MLKKHTCICEMIFLVCGVYTMLHDSIILFVPISILRCYICSTISDNIQLWYYAGSSFRSRSGSCYIKLHGLQNWGIVSHLHSCYIAQFCSEDVIYMYMWWPQGQGFMVGVNIDPIPGLPAGFPVIYLLLADFACFFTGRISELISVLFLCKLVCVLLRICFSLSWNMWKIRT